MKTPHRTRVSARLWHGLLAVLLLASLCLGAAPGRALANGTPGVVFVGTPGTGAPPATLGPYTMVPFGADPRPLGELVSTVPGPTGELVFDREGFHANASDWGTWSHGYAGDVYAFRTMRPADIQEPEGFDRVSITLPPGTMAFYFYLEPNNLAEYAAVVECGGVGSGLVPVDGFGGATYFGFYSTGAPLESVQVAVDVEAGGFAIGEFGIATAPGGSPRADVAVVVFGGWSGIPVQAWVGGTVQPTLYTAPDAQGEAAVLFTFWPPEGAAWRVSAAPSLPAGLDPALWEFKLVGIRRGGVWGSAPETSEVSITRGTEIVLYYQLISKAAG